MTYFGRHEKLDVMTYFVVVVSAYVIEIDMIVVS